MEAVKFIINGSSVYFEAEIETCVELIRDDTFALDHIMRAIMSGQLVESHGFTPEMWTNGHISVVRSEEQLYCPAALTQLESASSDRYDDVCNEISNDGALQNDSLPNCRAEENDEEVHGLVWLDNKKSTSRDTEATYYLLEMRQKDFIKNMFADKKTSKISIWNKIASGMNTAGFKVGEGREGAIRCRQKFSNLQRGYITFINHTQGTGRDHIKPPPFYDELHQILGNKDKVFPKYLIDSMDSPKSLAILDQSLDADEDLAIPGPSSKPDVVNDEEVEITTKRKTQEKPNTSPVNSSSKFTNKKQKTKNEIIEAIEKMQKEQMSSNERMFNLLKDNFECQNEMLKNQNVQRDAFLKLLERLLSNEGKSRRQKRRRSSSSDD